MTIIKTSYNRRSFLKTTALAGGGMMLGFSWLASCTSSPEEMLAMPKEWFNINGFLKIGENGLVTIMSPNPEIGQNVTFTITVTNTAHAWALVDSSNSRVMAVGTVSVV